MRLRLRLALDLDLVGAAIGAGLVGIALRHGGLGHLRGRQALALEHEGAVTFADAMLRRLVHPLGPCLQAACLQSAHQRFLQHRRWLVDDDAPAAIAALQAEVATLTGELDCWRDNAVDAGHGGGEQP